MQIINNIELICTECGKIIPTELSVGRKYNPDRWIFKVMPCINCAPNHATPSISKLNLKNPGKLSLTLSDREIEDFECELENQMDLDPEKRSPVWQALKTLVEQLNGR